MAPESSDDRPPMPQKIPAPKGRNLCTNGERRSPFHAEPRLRAKPITVSELVDHYRQRELEPDTAWKTHSTKVTYQGYLNKWILPRWGAYPLSRIQAGEVELWLRSLPLARATCAKARNLLCILFNHGTRYKNYDRTPSHLLRHKAERSKI